MLHIGRMVMRVDMALFPRLRMCAEKGIDNCVTEVVQLFIPENGAMSEVMCKIERQQQGRVPIKHVTECEYRRTRWRVQARVKKQEQSEPEQKLEQQFQEKISVAVEVLILHAPADNPEQFVILCDMYVSILQKESV